MDSFSFIEMVSTQQVSLGLHLIFSCNWPFFLTLTLPSSHIANPRGSGKPLPTAESIDTIPSSEPPAIIYYATQVNSGSERRHAPGLSWENWEVRSPYPYVTYIFLNICRVCKFFIGLLIVSLIRT